MNPNHLRLVSDLLVVIAVLFIWLPVALLLSMELPFDLLNLSPIGLGVIVDTLSVISFIWPEMVLSWSGTRPLTPIDWIIDELSNNVASIERIRKEVRQLKLRRFDALLAKEALVKSRTEPIRNKVEIH